MDTITILNYRCQDETGDYETVVALERKPNGMIVAHYADFDSVVSIAPNRRMIDIHVPMMLKAMLAEDSWIMPRVRFSHQETWQREA